MMNDSGYDYADKLRESTEDVRQKLVQVGKAIRSEALQVEYLLKVARLRGDKGKVELLSRVRAKVSNEFAAWVKLDMLRTLSLDLEELN